MTDEVARLREAALEAARRQSLFEDDVAEVQRLAIEILRMLPADADIAASTVVSALFAVVRGAEEMKRGVGVELIGFAIHSLMAVALEMGADDA